MPHTHNELSQTGFQGRTLDEHEHIKVHRLNEKLPTDKSHCLFASIAEVSAGEPVSAHYHTAAVLYIIEGELHIKDESNPDEVTKVVAGDVIHIDQGSNSISSTPNKVKFFAASYAPLHAHPEEYIVKK